MSVVVIAVMLSAHRRTPPKTEAVELSASRIAAARAAFPFSLSAPPSYRYYFNGSDESGSLILFPAGKSSVAYMFGEDSEGVLRLSELSVERGRLRFDWTISLKSRRGEGPPKPERRGVLGKLLAARSLWPAGPVAPAVERTLASSRPLAVYRHF